MAEKNTYRFALALIFSALVHIAVVFYVAEEKDSPVADAANSITVRLELVAGKVKLVGDTGENKNKIEEVPSVSEYEEIISVIADKPAEKIKEKNREDLHIQADSFEEKESENHQQMAKANSDKADEFLKLVYIEINKNKYYPYQARRQRREGRVKINFKLHPDGHVSEIMVLESSRFNVLDHAAQKAVQSISPFLMAANYLQVETEFNVNIDYQLN